MSERFPVESLDDVLENRVAGYWGANDRDDDATVLARVVRAGDISPEGQLLGFAERWLKPREIGRAGCLPGDVLITASGNGLGKAYLVREGDEVTSSNFTRRLVPDPARVLGGYVYLALQSEQGLAKLREHTATSAFPNLKPTFFADRWLPVPPLPVQCRIVDLLTHLDAHIANLRTERESVQSLLEAARLDVLGQLEPTEALADVLSQARAGGTPNRNTPGHFGGEIPWLKSGEVDSPSIAVTEESITEAGLASCSAWVVPASTVVLAMYGATAGVTGFISEPMATNQAVLALVANPERAESRFLYHWMKFNAPRLKSAASGAAQPNLSKQVVMRETGFPAIPVESQRGILQVLDVVEACKASSDTEIGALLKLRANTLQSLLAGDVPLTADYDSFLSKAS